MPRRKIRPRSRLSAGLCAGAGVVLAVALSVGAAQGAPASDGKADSAVHAKATPTDHLDQYGLALGLLVPFKLIFPYGESSPCDASLAPGEDGPPVCGFAAPWALDLGLSYAVSERLEPYLWARIGLGSETKTNTAPLLVFGLGTRLYTLRTDAFRLFLEFAAGVEVEGPARTPLPGEPPHDTDFMGHINFGGQYDFNEYAGAYLKLGPDLTFVRALGAYFGGTLGLQVRGP